MTPDTLLVDKAKGGDLGAFEVLVQRHQDHVRALAAWVAPRADLADDLAQETFCEAYRSLPKYSGAGEFRQWLRGIARNLARQQWAVYTRQTRVEHDGLAEYVENLASARDDEPSVLWEQKVEALRECVKRLMPQSARLVELRHSQGLTSEEIAKLVNSRASSVRTALTRIHDKLRECIVRSMRLGDSSQAGGAGAVGGAGAGAEAEC